MKLKQEPTTPYQSRKRSKLCVRGCGRQAVKNRTRCRWCKAQQQAYFKAYRKRAGEDAPETL
jgi:hypothetical protein